MMASPSMRELTAVFARIGCLSFGGPAGQIALMHDEIVEQRGWVGEDEFLRALNFCHLLPGPEAQQLATWIGWKLHGVRGGLIAGLLFVVPGAAVILALSLFYVAAAVRWARGSSRPSRWPRSSRSRRSRSRFRWWCWVRARWG
jgi:chromate transporter